MFQSSRNAIQTANERQSLADQKQAQAGQVNRENELFRKIGSFLNPCWSEAIGCSYEKRYKQCGSKNHQKPSRPEDDLDREIYDRLDLLRNC